MNKNYGKRYLIIFGILIFLSLVIYRPFIDPALAKPISTKTKSPDPLVQSLERQIQSDKLSDYDRDLLETKVAILNSDATMRARAADKLPSYRPTVIRQVSVAAPSDDNRFLGIIDYPSVPFSTMEYLIQNGWQQKIGNGYVRVFAGVGRDDMDQGILIVETETPHKFTVYKTPNKSGSLKIVDFKGFQLTLQAKNSDIFFFDVPGQLFIPSLGVTVPTVTPAPSQKGTTEPSLMKPTPTVQAYP
jgi:hypothetical protein